jgi:predicted dehydrogenase/NADPH:quinone reductase-like Zn-dependent oxidoreductase
MQQLVQSLRDGGIGVSEAPSPVISEGAVLIRSRATLISSGTERMLVEFGRAGWIEKARQQPDKVRQALEKIRTDGLPATLEAVRAKLDQPVALGYSNAGVVLAVGPGVTEFRPGDRVVSNGPHAEVASVPKNLCARIPEGVSDEAAAFTVLGAIALEGVRLAQPALGETFCVIGLGLIGLLAVQILRAHGCRVVGLDPDARRLELARQFGAVPEAQGELIDGVLICAATRSSEPVHRAAQMCRKRGRIVLVGVTGLELSRDDFYKKELTFQVSCSYGPGRYDPAYEEKGQDYPIGYVRWTAQRNFEAILQLMAEGKLDVAPLITHRFPFERAAEAYEVILGKEPHLGVLLEYPDRREAELRATAVCVRAPERRSARPSVALIGAGQHAVRMLLPALRDSGARLKVIADVNGVAAVHAARKFGFEAAASDSAAVLADEAVDTVFIATRHDSHARLVCEALRAGKHVYVEKPLAIRESELEEVEQALGAAAGILMVGFNRRFAPHVVRMKELLERAAAPKAMVMTVNAGAVPEDHWTQDPERGGGRIIGEACHFIDLLRYLAGARIRSTSVARLSADTVTITLGFADGSIGAVHYFANGHRSFPKERLEVFCGGRILQLDNFRCLRGYGWPGFRTMRLWRQDKGHRAAVAAFLAAVRDGRPSPVPLEEAIEVSRATFQVA